MYAALAQLTDKIDPMYIIPKDRPGPHNDACVICFLSVSDFGHQGPKKWLLGLDCWIDRSDFDALT